MTRRWIVSGVAVAALFVATAGIAYAAGTGSTPPASAPAAGQMCAACDGMHDSPAMEAMHEQMPAALQQRCDALHEQMAQLVGGSGMTGGSGMMGNTGMGSGSMSEHHASTEG
jgi:hypothetical protein